MEFHPNELTLLLDPKSPTGRKLRAYAHSISNNVNEIDYTTTRLTTTVWKEIVTMLGNNPKSLIDKNHPLYKEKVKGNTFTMHGMLNVLLNSPELLKGPIAIRKNKAILCDNPMDILKLGITSNIPNKTLPHLRVR